MIDKTVLADNQSRRVGDGSLESLLGEVAGEFFDRMTSGERPQIDEYVERYPEIAEQIRCAFPALQVVGDSQADSGPQLADMDLKGQKTLGDFRILHELGRGGMGVVYEAEQLSMGRKVALKVLPFAAIAQEKSLQRFRNEVRAAGTLNHPSIVPIYSVGEERGVHFFAMQLIRGQTMAEVIAQLVHLQADGQTLQSDSMSRALSVAELMPLGSGVEETTGALEQQQGHTSESQLQSSQQTRSETQARISTEGNTYSKSSFVRSAARLGVQAADALQHAHDRGVLHRDVKPGNLMLDAHGQLYIADFGLAHVEADVGVTMTGDLVGTLRYMSPEQALAKRIVIDNRSDIYSLGVTLYELLTLRPPFDGENRQELLKQIAFEDPPKPRQISRSIPHELETIICKAIEKNPDERYATAEELAEDLRAFLEDRAIKAKPPSLIQRTAKWSRRHRPLVWSAGVSTTLLLLLAVAILAVSNAMVTDERDEKDEALRARTQALAEKDAALATADANFNKALESVDQMLARVGNEKLADVPQMKVLRAELLQDAVSFYEELLKQDPSDGDVRGCVASTRVALGEAFKILDRRTEARAEFHQAIRMSEELANQFPEDRNFQLILANACDSMGWLLTEAEESRKAHRSAATIYERLRAEAPNDNSIRWRLARTYQAIAVNLLHMNGPSDAEDVARQAIDLIDALEGDKQGVDSAAYSALAQVLRAQGRLKEADVAYETAVRLQRKRTQDMPPYASPQRFLARRLFHRGVLLRELKEDATAEECFVEACDIFQRVAASYPNAPAFGNELREARRSHLRLLIETDRTEAAEQVIRDVNWNSATELWTLANAYEDAGNYDTAVAFYEKSSALYLKDASLSSEFLLRLANLSLNGSTPNIKTLSLKYAELAAERDANDASTMATLGYVQFQCGFRQEALRSAKRAFELDPTIVAAGGDYRAQRVWYSIPFNEFMEEARYNEALTLIDTWIEVYQGDLAHLYKRRALIRFKLAHYDEALADITKAVDRNPDATSNLTWIAPALAANCPDEAFRTGLLEQVDRTIELNRGSASAYSTSAALHIAFGMHDRARADLKELLKLKSESSLTWYHCAMLTLRFDQPDRYRDLCSSMVKHFAETQNLNDAHWTAWTCALLPNAVDNYDPCVRLAEALSSDTTNSQHLGTLGAVLFRAGRCEEASRRLQQNIDLWGDALPESHSPAYTWFFLAMAEQQLDRDADAQKWLDKAVQRTEQELANDETSWNRRANLELLRDEATALVAPNLITK